MITYSAPLHVSPDGYLYLQSSKYVFSADALNGYHWIREPGYPLILRAERIAFGVDDRGIVLLQAVAFAIAANLAAISVLPRRPVAQTAAIILTALNPVTMMYAGSVLQTAWICLSVAGFAWLVSRCWAHQRTHIAYTMAGLALWTALSANLAFQLGYLGLSAGAAAGAGIALNHPRIRTAAQSGATRAVTAIAFAGVGAVILTTVGIVSLIPWETYKAGIVNQTVDTTSATDSRGLATAYTGEGPSGALRAVLEDPVNRVGELSVFAVQLVSARKGLVDENRIYTDAMLQWPCGALEEAAMIQAARDEALTLVRATCRSPQAMRGLAIAAPLGYGLLAMSGVALVLAMVVLPFVRRLREWAALLPQAQLVFMYAAAGLGFTRYGFSSYQFGVAALVLLSITAVGLATRVLAVAKRRGSRTTRLDGRRTHR